MQRYKHLILKIRTRPVSDNTVATLTTVYCLVGGSGQHKKFMPLVREQPRVNFDRQLKVKR